MVLDVVVVWLLIKVLCQKILLTINRHLFCLIKVGDIVIWDWVQIDALWFDNTAIVQKLCCSWTNVLLCSLLVLYAWSHICFDLQLRLCLLSQIFLRHRWVDLMSHTSVHPWCCPILLVMSAIGNSALVPADSWCTIIFSLTFDIPSLWLVSLHIQLEVGFHDKL